MHTLVIKHLTILGLSSKRCKQLKERLRKSILGRQFST